MIREVRVPDIGDFDQVDVIEVLVEQGQEVTADESLITLESDKASMDVPAPQAGTIVEVGVAVGDQVGEGHLIVKLEVAEGEDSAGKSEDGAGAETSGGDEGSATERAAAGKQEAAPEEPKGDSSQAPAAASEEAAAETEPPAEKSEMAADSAESAKPAGGYYDAVQRPKRRAEPVPRLGELRSTQARAHASPSVRRLAREMGIDLLQVAGSGRKGRILTEDLKGYVKQRLRGADGGPATVAASGGFTLPEMPKIDFSKFGPVEEAPLSRIRKIAKRNLHRSWLHVPHVTQHDEADITEMEVFRKAHKEEAKKRGVNLTPLAFLIKGAVAALQEFPRVNSSLAPSGEALILKRYYHLGIAVDTEDGLVVPVIRNCDQKGLYELAAELGEISERARAGKLRLDDLQGATFSISSLGGIGGTAFTPIVNAPEAAILGVSRARQQPVYRNGELVARLILPISLSYDHRIVDGAEAVRFTTFLCGVLGDIRRLLL